MIPRVRVGLARTRSRSWTRAREVDRRAGARRSSRDVIGECRSLGLGREGAKVEASSESDAEDASGSRYNSGGSLHFASDLCERPMSDTSTTVSELVQRPKRADARRNYDRLLAAAHEAFTEHGS